MDLALGPEDAAFEAEVERFLEDNVTDDIREAGRLTGGVLSDFDACLKWTRILHGRGWSAPAWPVDYGGPGWTAIQRYIFDSACQRAGTPRLFSMGTRMVGPVVMRYGTDAQKADYLPSILSGEDTWCQGYSEPGSGSDLASLQTRAVADGEDYLVNGSKIWTTGAQFANRMFCLVRTATEGKPQEGISFLLIDMDTPGIVVEPIISFSGDHELNQVFFDDVRVPRRNRVGEENQGWTVAKYLLEFERGGAAYSPGLHAAIRRIRRIAAQARTSDAAALADDAGFRRELAAAEIAVTATEMTEKRVMSALSQGQNPGSAASQLKVMGSELLQCVTELAVTAIGYYAAPDQPDARVPGSNVAPIGTAEAVTVVPKYLNSRAATIYAGSNEIQRNILAKAVLGM